MSRTYRARKGTRCLVCGDVLVAGQVVRPIVIGYDVGDESEGLAHGVCVLELVSDDQVDDQGWSWVQVAER